MEDFAKRLLDFTKDCRVDMHEPDEQGIKAFVVGDHLDNAYGERIDVKAIEGHYQEYVVVLQENEITFETQKFNLATLIAFARIGAKAIILENVKQ